MASSPSVLSFEQALAQPTAAFTATDERILDAALVLIGQYGTRRTSIDDIAERARVNRRTVFRRFESKQGVIDHLYVRELQRLFVLLRTTAATAPDPESSVVEVFVAAVRFATRHPLVDRLVRIEPQVLIEAVRAPDPPILELMRGFVADRIRSGQRRGRIPAGDVDQRADVLIRLALAYILIPSPCVDIADDVALRAFARSAIAPVLIGGS
jgi:AcrR family transcriptional regulator